MSSPSPALRFLPSRTFSLYAVVFLAGIAVMVIELLGTRLVAPFYGTSLFVWTSLIAVTMVALALGYFAGGRLADRGFPHTLSILLLLSGLLTGGLPWLTRPVLELTNELGLRAGALLSALLLFLPSLMLLGMIGPLAIRRVTVRLGSIGASAGNVYAVSTLGSVLGTLVLGFFLFPTIGSHQILKGLGFLLSLIGATIYGFEPKESARRSRWLEIPAVLTALLFSGLLAFLSPRPTGSTGIKVISEVESLYGWVRVMDLEAQDIRILTSDASVIGAETHSTGESRLTYQIIADVIPSLRPGMKRALLIGQGAGHIAMVLDRLYGIKTDTIEIDPAVAAAAVQYFGFKPTGEARVGDARYEIAHMKGPYDLIIHDCFTGGSEPTHLLTQETFALLKGLLNPCGVMAINTVGFLENGKNPAIASVAKTIDAVFPYRQVFLAMPGDDFNDFVMIGSDAPVGINAPELPEGMRNFLQQRTVVIDASQGSILTDDFNPFEHLQLRKSEKYRQLVTEWIGLDLMVR